MSTIQILTHPKSCRAFSLTGVYQESTQFVEKKYGTIITLPVSDLYPSIPRTGGLSIIVEWNESLRRSPSFRFHGQPFRLEMKYSTIVAHFTLCAFVMVSFSEAGEQHRNSTGRRCICSHECDFKTKLSVCECVSKNTRNPCYYLRPSASLPVNNYFL